MLALNVEIVNGSGCSKYVPVFEKEKVLPHEQKRCKKGSGGTKDQLLIDNTILRD